MKYLLGVLLLLIASALGNTQPATEGEDDLRTQIEQATEDTMKIKLYDELFLQLYSEKRLDELDPVIQQGLALARKLNDEPGMALMNYRMGIIQNIQSNAHAAIDYFGKASELVDRLAEPHLAAKIYLNRGSAYYFIGDLDLALANYLEADLIYEEVDKKAEQARLLNNIGVIYRLQEKYDRAREIYEKSYAIKQELQDTAGMAASLQNIGLLYSYLTDTAENGLRYLEESRRLYEYLDYAPDLAGSQVALGDTYLRLGRWAAAKTELEQAWSYYEQHPEHEYTVSALTSLGKIARHDGELAVAEDYFQKALAFGRSLDQKTNMLSTLLELSEVQHELGHHLQAFTALQEAFALQDSLNAETRLEAIEEMQTRFDVRQKEQDLKISQLELSERTRQRNSLVLGAVFLAMLAGVIFFSLRSRIRINQRVAQQEAELQEQRISRLEQEKKMAVLHAMLEGQEQERSRIANDLHDGLGGLLSAVKSHFSASLTDRANTELPVRVNQLIDQACGEVHRISHNMMPRILALAGLHGAIESLVQQLRQKGLHCELELIGLKDASLSDKTATGLFRIIQELTNNVVKHAHAQNLFLQVIHQEGTFTIIVEDDGQGFSVEEARQKDGLGLASVRARVDHLQGEIHWDSVPGEGTTVSINI